MNTNVLIEMKQFFVNYIYIYKTRKLLHFKE